MRRILLVPLFAFTVGWLAAATIVSAAPAPGAAAVVFAAAGAVAAALYLRRRQNAAVVVSLGFLIGVVWSCGVLPMLASPSVFVELVGERREDLLVEAVVVEGPRFWPDGAMYEVAVTTIDGRSVKGERVRLWVSSDLRADPLWPDDEFEVFGRASRYRQADFPRVEGAREMMRRRGIVGRLVAREAPEVSHQGWSLARFAAQNRVRLERFVVEQAPTSAPIIVAMLTGSRGGLSERTWETFRDTGTAHVLAISGLHFGVLSALLWALGTAIARRSLSLCRHIGARRFASGFVLAGLAAYLLMVGAPVSAVRAWVALAVAVVALWVLRRPSVFGAICVAAVALSAGEPGIVNDLGFRLSFAATLGITVFWYRRPAWLRRDPYAFEEESRARRIVRGLLGFVGISWAASAATTPILLATHGMVSVAGPLVNLVIVPWVSVVVFPMIVAGAVGEAFFPAAGAVAFAGADVLLQHTELVLAQIAASPWCVWIPGVGARFEPVLMLVVIFALMWRRLRPLDVLLTLAMAAAFVVYAEERRNEPPPVVRVHFIPVGQGDATLLEGPDGSRILIDAGGSQLGRDPGRHIVVPYLRRLGITRLDAVVVTHDDIDHSGGVPAVLEFIEVGRVVREPADLGVSWLDLERFEELGSKNELSIVAWVEFDGARMLLTGDIEARAESAAIRDGKARRSLLLKVPHHGSKTSSTEPFLDAVQPRVAVVSAGLHNRFGHPHPHVVERYEDRAVRLFSTAENGLIIVELTPASVVTVFACR